MVKFKDMYIDGIPNISEVKEGDVIELYVKFNKKKIKAIKKLFNITVQNKWHLVEIKIKGIC